MSTLNAQQWLALRPYLETAFEMAAQERATWLASIREQDPALAAQLASLLEEHELLSQKGFLEKGNLKSTVKAGEIVKWLKEDFGLGHGHAMAIYAIFKGMK